MGRFLDRDDKALFESTSPVSLPRALINYIEQPDLSAVVGFASKYWTITGDVVTLKTQGERDAVDAAEAAAITQENRDGATGAAVAVTSAGVETRALIELLNKRDNFLTNRIIELQNRVQAMLDSTGAVANMRIDGLAVSISATATRTKADAVTDYTDDINAGNQDT